MRLTDLLRPARIAVDDAAPCENCGMVMAPHRGIREHGRVFCSDDCADDNWSSRSW